jgi:UDP-N-acetylmuramoyl-L-alanyl-D-glutamate--2,6-diaminopimelate ligase
MTVGALLEATPAVAARIVGDPSASIGGMALDSRLIESRDLFCCLRGEHADGHRFAPAAVAAGAGGLLVDHELDDQVSRSAAQVVVADTRRAVGPLAATLWDHPSARLTTIGVTGTNGKTTTTALVAAVLEAAGWSTGVIGTLTGSFTTPEAPELQARLAELVDEGRRAVAMEVSSHALAMHRVDGTRFAVSVFTNLGRDHLDFHGTTERYFAAKAALFTPDLSDRAVVNVDDVRGRQLVDVATIPTTPYSLADAEDVEVDAATARFRWHGQRVRLPLGGRFNVSNAVAAATVASLIGIDDATIAAGLSAAPPVPGRMEAIDAGQPFRVVVDFAHTPDALAGLLDEVRAVTAGRVIVVFGCGGDRDAAKRPLMGRVAAERADLSVVTSDNPRTEDPAAIIAAVVGGVPVSRRSAVVIEADRRAAIALGLSSARAGDAVVIAGKGHETTQTIGTDRRPFDDRTVARELLEGAS